MATMEGRDWRHSAVCRDEDPELFFPVGTGGPALMQVAEAKSVCARCPVVEQCRSWALASGEDAGVWGGMSEDERRALRRRARRRSGRAESADGGSARVVARPVGGSRREVAAAGRAAVASGEPVASVARRFEVSDRTVYHWRAAVTASAPADDTAGVAVAGSVVV